MMQELDNKIVGNRLKAIFEALGISAIDVAKHFGVGNSRIYNLTYGVAKPNFDTIYNLLLLYPNINLDYIYTGRGYPLKGSSTIVDDDRMIELPYYDSESSFVVSEPVSEYGKKIRIVSSGLDLTDCVVCDVFDNSMSPQLNKGQKLVLRPVLSEEWDWMRSGVYAVRYANYVAVRRVKENDLRENGKLVLYADNAREGSIHLKRSDIISIYSVIQVFGSVE